MANKIRKKILSLIMILFVGLANASLSLAQEKPLKKIRWGVTAISASNWIPWIAKEAKIYEKNGLDVELILLRGSGQTSQAMIGGSIFAAPVTIVTVMNADLSGADLVTVAHTVKGLRSRLMAKPELKRPEDLKGKKLGVSSFGSLEDFFNRYILRKYGLDPERDVTMLTLGGPPERFQALASGAIDAASLTYPWDVLARRQGFSVIWDTMQEVTYPSMSVVTRRKYIQEDRDTVMRLVKSHVEAIHYLKTHKDFSMKVLAKHLRTDDRELLEGAYGIFSKDFLAVPYPITQGLQAAYEYIALKRPEVWKHKPEEFADSSFLAELDKGGFIKKLSEGR